MSRTPNVSAVDPPATPDDPDATAATDPSDPTATADPDDPDDVVVLPWWNNPINLIAIAIGLILVIGSLGWVLGSNNALPDPNRVDIGFLQDMRTHHEQAVQMSFIYIADPGTDPALYEEAQEIIVGQNLESGLMVQLLRDFGAAEANETDTAMAWMGEPTPLERMPGMATDTDLDTLGTLTGAAADKMFVQLMVAHHQGGIHMADDATTHANESSVRELAKQISGSQTEEVAELQQLLASSQTT